MMKTRKWYFIFGSVAIVILFWLSFGGDKNNVSEANIILSSHYDDAVLSLGGLISKGGGKNIVATFFTGAPDTATSTYWDIASGFKDSSEAVKIRSAENKNALEKESNLYDFGYLDNQYRTSKNEDLTKQSIVKDIQELLNSALVGSTTVNVYGPANFGEKITHKDHKILHDAFLDIIDSNDNKNINFYFYEDFPYISLFNKSSAISVKKYLEDETGFLLTSLPVEFNKSILDKKIEMMKKYASQIKAFKNSSSDILGDMEKYFSRRCGEGKNCEMVYKIFQSE